MGIDSLPRFGLNECMRTLVAVALVAVLCGCPGPRPPVRVDAPVIRDTKPTPPQPPPPAQVEEPPVPADVPRPREEPAERPPDAAQIVEALNRSLEDAFFNYDSYDLRTDALEALRRDAALLAPVLSQFGALRVVIEGHCDERGSAEYNLGLGDRRARRAAELLEESGIPPARVRTISYGREMPQCTEAMESCWSRNRRAHLTVQP